MTDRIKGLTITLSHDIRDDDVQPIIDAIKMIKGVIDVSNSVVGSEDIMNRSRISLEYRNAIIDMLDKLK